MKAYPSEGPLSLLQLRFNVYLIILISLSYKNGTAKSLCGVAHKEPRAGSALKTFISRELGLQVRE